MKIELKKEQRNPHMKRKELQIAVDHENEPTPTKAALEQLVAKQLGHNADNTDVRSIHTEGGIGKSTAKVFVWNGKKPEPKEKKAKKGKKAKAKAKN